MSHQFKEDSKHLKTFEATLQTYKNNISANPSKTKLIRINSFDREKRILYRYILLSQGDSLLMFNSNYITILSQKNLVASKIAINDKINNNEIINVYNYNNQYWIFTSNGIFIGNIISGEFVLQKHIFDGYYMATFLEDNNKGLWITTLTNGVFYIPNPSNVSIEKEGYWPLLIKNVTVFDDNHYAYANSPDQIIVHAQQHVDTFVFERAKMEYFNKIKYNRTGDSLLSSTILSFRSISLGNEDINAMQAPVIKDFINYQNKLILGGGKYLHEFANNKIIELTRKLPAKVASLGTYNDKLYLGTPSGFYRVYLAEDTLTLKELFEPSLDTTSSWNKKKQQVLQSYIVDLEPSDNGIWIAARGYGVGYYTDSLEFVIGTDDGLSSAHISDITQDGDTLWIATDDGLNKVLLENNRVTNIIIYNKNNGLSSNEIAGVEVSKNKIFVSTRKGLDIMSRKNITGKINNYTLAVTGFYPVNSPEVSLFDKKLTYNENDVTITYNAIQLCASRTHLFRYRLTPMEKEWTTTPLYQANYHNLIPGDYEFEIAMKNTQGNWVGNKKLNFVINPPFWKTWWFIPGVIGTILLFLFFVFKNREQKYRNKLQMENEMRRLKGKALRAQVNPHFIFNTLNAIQGFVLEGDFERSNKFISEFSKLIRMILHQSDKNIISLTDEIKMLKMYLEIEQMRFGNKFDFTIDIIGDIPVAKIKILPMLLQPYVENAIWHGLVDPTKHGKIGIKFVLEKEFLVCTIIDNGIGRKAAAKLKNETSKKRKSVGMTLSNDRLQALTNNNQNHVMVTDLYNETKEPMGTKITINIPINTP